MKKTNDMDPAFWPEEESQTFMVETEDGTEHLATIISVVTIDGIEYAIYSIENSRDPQLTDVLASYVLKDEDGYDTLADIDDPEDKRKIYNFIAELVYGKFD